MLPELTSRIVARAKAIMAGFGSSPISLELKDGGVGNDLLKDARLYPQLYSILGGGQPAWSGELVNTTTALNHSVVWACNRLIAGTLGMIPCVMLQQKGASKQVADKHPMYSCLLNAPNAEITAMAFSEMLTSHCLLQGNSYAKITRRSGTGTAIGLDYLLPQNVYPDREKEGQRRIVYTIKDGSLPDKTYTVQDGKPQDILHIRGLGWDGIRGYSVISMGRQSIGTAIASERNVARFYAGGGRVPYILKTDKKFGTDQDREQFRDDWERNYSQPHRTPILEPWLTYEKIGMSATDAQLLETRLFHIHEVCRWFGVSPHLVGDLSRATFSNIEQLALEFVKMTMSYWITRWEQELWRCVLTDEEKTAGYFWRHDLKSLLRGDFATRVAGYASALQNGWLSQDEVRDEEDMNGLPDGAGSHYHIQLNMQPLQAGGVPLTTDQSQLVRLG